MGRREAILAERGLAPIWRLRREFPKVEEGEAQSLARTDAAKYWVELKQLVSGCVKCGLHKTRTQTVFGVGDPAAQWMLIGEAPGADEDRLGDPFVGQAGRLLDNMLAAIGIERGKNVSTSSNAARRETATPSPRRSRNARRTSCARSSW